MQRLFLSVLLIVVIIPSLWAKTMLVVGDSLSAGFGLNPQQGWVQLLQQRLQQQKRPYQVVNVSVSGATTANGLASLPRYLQQYQPEIVLIQLGANDGLRGLALQQMRQNLQQMIHLSQAANAKVLLIATRLPPNYGPAYLQQFAQVYANLAKKNHVPLTTMLLKGVAARPSLLQQDQLHPNQQAQRLLLNNVWPQLEPLLEH